jgi:enamine deaminase RidA (YjgF/YER057c/UK114 family)
MTIAARIQKLNLEIPSFTPANNAFKPYILTGNTLVVSGQLPFVKGNPAYKGRVPQEVSIEDARAAARICILNILSIVQHVTNNDFDKVEQVVRLGGFVATSEGFYDAPGIINAASELVLSVFDDKAGHARVAMGVASLPGGMPVEIEATITLKD